MKTYIKLSTILILILSFNAHAKWDLISTIDRNNFSSETYIEIDSIKRKGNISSVKELINMVNIISSNRTSKKNIYGGGRFNFGSIITEYEYDCIQKKYRALSGFTYEDHMGKGKVVDHRDVSGDSLFGNSWQSLDLPDGSQNKYRVKVFNIVCSK